VILSFAKGFAYGFASGFASRVAKASVKRAVEGVAAKGVKAKTLAFAFKDTVDAVNIKAFAVAIRY